GTGPICHGHLSPVAAGGPPRAGLFRQPANGRSCLRGPPRPPLLCARTFGGGPSAPVAQRVRRGHSIALVVGQPLPLPLDFRPRAGQAPQGGQHVRTCGVSSPPTAAPPRPTRAPARRGRNRSTRRPGSSGGAGDASILTLQPPKESSAEWCAPG